MNYKEIFSEYILSTIFMSVEIISANMANTVIKSSENAIKTLELISCETSLNSKQGAGKPHKIKAFSAPTA